MMALDSAAAAASQARLDAGLSAACFWDADRHLSEALAPLLGLHRRHAWDVYLLYPAGVRWTGMVPPRPRFWMHQLDGETAGPWLDERTLEHHLAELLPP